MVWWDIRCMSIWHISIHVFLEFLNFVWKSPYGFELFFNFSLFNYSLFSSHSSFIFHFFNIALGTTMIVLVLCLCVSNIINKVIFFLWKKILKFIFQKKISTWRICILHSNIIHWIYLISKESNNSMTGFYERIYRQIYPNIN